jgi:hypothetical protein
MTRLSLLRTLAPASLLAALACGSAAAADARIPASRPLSPEQVLGEEVPGHRVPLMFDPRPSDLRIPAPPEIKLEQKGLKAVQATVNVTFLPAGQVNVFGDHCTAWTQPARDAFTFAANVWGSQLQSAVPITVEACFADQLGAGILGAAGPAAMRKNTTTNSWYPIALANSLAGTDLNGSTPEVYASFSSTFQWYYGTDGNVPSGQMDFVSVVLHEIGHGLGFTGGLEVDTGLGVWADTNPSPAPFAYDRFTENGAGQSLIAPSIFPNPSAALASALQSGAVFFDGPNANAGNGGTRVSLYAPSIWNGGSSYSHLGEVFNGTPNALMTFSLSSRESIHSPGPVTLGILKDLGWQMQNASSSDVALAQAVTPNPATVGKDVVFTMTVTNNGPGTATGVTVTTAYDGTAAAVWASPGCVKQAGPNYVCTVGTLANGASTQVKLVLRKAVGGSIFNNAAVASGTADSNTANNGANASVSLTAAPAGVAITRYRLYSPITLEHHFTTDLNEYNVLGTMVGTWSQEGAAGKVLDNPGSFNGVTAVPYYRLYCDSTRWHHWTTDANEYYTLSNSYPCWHAEGVDGYILPSATAGATELYRLVYLNGTGLHHWTVDENEVHVLTTTLGWAEEAGAGFVIQ